MLQGAVGMGCHESWPRFYLVGPIRACISLSAESHKSDPVKNRSCVLSMHCEPVGIQTGRDINAANSLAWFLRKLVGFKTFLKLLDGLEDSGFNAPEFLVLYQYLSGERTPPTSVLLI